MTSKRVALSLAFLSLAAGSAACGVGGPSDDGYDDLDRYEYNPPANQPVSQSGSSGSSGGSTYTAPITEDHVFYCGDENEIIVAEENCDYDTGGLFFLYHGVRWAKNLKPGATIPKGGFVFDASDEYERAHWGMPTTGRITNGTVRTGIVGSSGSSNTVGG